MSTFAYYILYFFCYLISLLPFGVLYFLSDLLYYPLYYLIRYRRKIVRKNLELSFPEKTTGEIVRIEKEFYSFFCDYLLETFKLLSISKETISKRMKFEGLEELNASFAEGHSCAAYLGHYCNWEWISSLPLSVDKNIVCGQIYHVLRNKATDRLFLKLRGRMGSTSIPMKQTLRRIITLRRENKQFVIGFISDQTPFWTNIHYWTDFLHRDTPVFTGTEKIARQANLSVYYMDVKRPKRGYYVATFRKMTDNPGELPEFELTERYMRELEKTIIREPQYWLWTHNRWKRTHEEFDELFEVMPDGHVKRRKENK